MRTVLSGVGAIVGLLIFVLGVAFMLCGSDWLRLAIPHVPR